VLRAKGGKEGRWQTDRGERVGSTSTENPWLGIVAQNFLPSLEKRGERHAGKKDLLFNMGE